MTALVNSPTVGAIFVALQPWLMDVLGLDLDHVVQDLGNGVSMPAGPFACMSEVSMKRLGTNVSTYREATPEEPDADAEIIQQSADFVVGLDLYGPAAGDWAVIVTTLFRSDQAVSFFMAQGLAPLGVDDPMQLPLVNGEQQYERRWVLRMHFHYKPSVAVPAQFMRSAQIHTISNATFS